MPVESNAIEDELTSPFFIENERICKEFDNFIVTAKGETRGRYNAWSYSAIGKVPHLNKWVFRITKSSYTSGNLFLSSKHQCLHLASNWTAHHLTSDCPNFIIRPRKTLFNKGKRLVHFKNYQIQGKNQKHPFIGKLTQILKTLFKAKLIYEVKYSDSKLEIELRSGELHTDIILELLKEQFDSK